MATQLNSTDEVIDALGGNARAAAIIGCNPKAVTNWRSSARGKFPAETFLVLQDALDQKGLAASVSLWGLREPPSRRPASKGRRQCAS